MTLKLDAPGVNEPELARTAAPHEVYLSSEEDGSSSADDFSDYDFDSESEMDPANATTATRKRSYEDIAKMVSVVYSGKPTVVQITTTKRSATPSSSSSSSTSSPSSTPSSAAVSRMSSPNLGRRQSSYTQSYYHHPPRTTSLALEGFTLHANSSQPAFLGIDPFADVTPEEAEAGHTSASGRSPSAVFKKTLGLVKKRSRPLLVTTLGNSSQARLDLVSSPSSSARDNANESRPETPVTP
ncbi:unnamed protein product [Parascedosporium putredinis]|uniref:Uncharacterized protein n=1 Tax=Parascedosporium putredinis TaxID=1442378 RepID=A0A9P1H0K0_9PEZI|nr:unnamed protein product [Parascedosporium putredinis]CAI7992894.1 unnamed protein product [Parascedosporium putredinis]